MEKLKSDLLKMNLNKNMRLSRITLRLTFLFVLLIWGSINLNGQDERVNSNPYEVIYNHLNYLQADSYDPEQASLSFVDTLDNRTKLAKKLKQILDGKGLYIDMNRVPQDANYKDSTRLESIYILDKSEPNIYLEKLDSSWYYSRTTVELIPEMHKKIYPFGTDFVTRFNAPVWQFKLLGIKLWKWFGLIIVLGIAQLMFYIISSISRLIIKLIVKNRIELTDEVLKYLKRMAKVIAYLASIRCILFFLPMFQLNPILNAGIFKLLNVLSIFFIIIFLKYVIKLLFVYFESVTERTDNTLDDQLLPVLYKLSLIIIWSLGIIYVLDYLNVNITALLAGISIGGLALALAAQDTVKNFFGSIMIFLDRPFQIGDLIEFKDMTGTVEEVGVRSTRIRTANNSLTYVPNALLADSIINNLGLRVFRRFNTNLTITYDTSADHIESFVDHLKKIVEAHPMTVKENYEIHLNAFGDSSINILFNVYFNTRIWREELRYRHEIMIAIIRLADKMGIRFAFPTRTLHIEEMPKAGTSNTPDAKPLRELEGNSDQWLNDIKDYFNNRKSELDTLND